MSLFVLSELRGASVWKIYRMRDQIDLDPVYQRESDIWTDEKKRLLIDTIINRFDVPKIYLHKLNPPRETENGRIEYAVIDGKQRLSAIFDFIDGEYTLAEDFEYLHDEKVDAKKLTYADLANKFPEIKTDLDSFTLNIVTIETSETELIEDLFSRLNEAVPLNAAEKRNAWAGPIPAMVRKICDHRLFTEKLPFSNKRYRHLDLASKFLMIVERDGSVVDTKKAYIDKFFKDSVDMLPDDVIAVENITEEILTRMANIFVAKDALLRSVGMTTLYFYLFQKTLELSLEGVITRDALEGFESNRAKNREIAADDISKANYELLEFDRYTQSPNDGIAMRYRLGVIDAQAFGGKLGFPMPG